MSEPTHKRFNFNPTVTTGDIMTAVVILIGGVGAYYTLSARVSVLEAADQARAVQAASDKTDQRDTIKGIRDDIKDMQRSMNALTLAIGAARSK